MNRLKNTKGHISGPISKGEDWTGKTVGLWTVLGYHSCVKKGSGRAYDTYWLCQCECGIVKPVLKGSILRNDSAGCRTCTTRRGEQSASWKGSRGVPGRKWSRLVKGAQIRDLEINITFDDIVDKFHQQQGRCAVTGLEISADVTGSVDRRDSSKGYTVDNIQWVHKDINRMKSDFTEDYFKELCRLVLNPIR